MNNAVFYISLSIAFVTLVLSVTYYNYSELKSVERNVESVIVKGIDPVAYAAGSAKK